MVHWIHMFFKMKPTMPTLLMLLVATLAVAAPGPMPSQTDPVSVAPMSSGAQSDVFAWDFAGWERDQDNNRVDDLLQDMIDAGLDALPRFADGFLPFLAHDGPSGPVVAVHVALDGPATAGQMARLDSIGQAFADPVLPAAWVTGVSPAAAVAIADMPGVVMVELQQQLRSLNNNARQAIQVDDSSTYPLGVWEDLGYTGDGVGVAILDTGGDDNHAYLQNRFVAGADTTKVCTHALDVNPDDDNQVTVGIIGAGVNTFHGTHVAGSALGHGAGLSNRGIAYEAEYYDVKVLAGAGLSCLASVEIGMIWVNSFNQGLTRWQDSRLPIYIGTGHEIDVVSMSLGGACSDGLDSLSQRANWLVARGVTVVVATGNDGTQPSSPQQGCITSPSAATNVISVGAFADRNTVTRSDDFVASFSNCGPSVYPPSSAQKKPDVTAPGVDIVSSMGDATVNGLAGSSSSRSLSGTSMATPLVAGVVALMLEKDPSLTPAQVKTHLRAEADHKTSGAGFSIGSDYHSCWGFGQVNAYATVNAV